MATGSISSVSPSVVQLGTTIKLDITYTINIGGLGIFPGWWSLLKVTINGAEYERWDYHPLTSTTATVSIECGTMPSSGAVAIIQLYAQTNYSAIQTESNMTLISTNAWSISTGIVPEVTTPTVTIPTVATGTTTDDTEDEEEDEEESSSISDYLPWIGMGLAALILLLPDKK